MLTDTQPPLAPATDATQEVLTDHYNANNTITAYAHALQNIQLNPVSDEPQDWFTNLQGSLTTAQQHAQSWVTDLGPQVFSKVPQSIINYTNIFMPATQQILDILKNIHGVPTPEQQSDINALIDAQLQTLGAEKQTILDLQAKLVQFANDIQADHTNLLTGENDAQKAVAIDETDMQKIQAKINDVQNQIQLDSKLALSSEIGLGVAIFIVVVGVALAVATEGAAAPLVAIGIGVLATGGAIAGTVIFSKKVSEDLDKLHDLQQQLSDEQAQVAALNGITSSVQSLVAANEQATKAMSDVLETWQTLEDKLQSVLDDLQKAEAPNLPAIIESLDIQTAQTAWGQLSDFATKMQQNSVTVQPPITNYSLN
ncbi:MAG TPA: HBL/NHE enterotoxin family protein [Herpetosiphonaceae bacterium]